MVWFWEMYIQPYRGTEKMNGILPLLLIRSTQIQNLLTAKAEQFAVVK